MNQHLFLRIILQKPTNNIDFGLQKGSGSKYETEQTQRSNGQDIHFNFAISVEGEKQKDPLPKLTGPFVQGPSSDKFIYIDIGTYAGQTDTIWSRRLKIPLAGIGWEIVDLISTDSKFILETTVPGTGRDGGPNCATVKPFDGWKLKVT
jgi:hypothetical protein